MKGHSGGSHNTRAVPDQQMGGSESLSTVGERKVNKRIAKKKRRQHGRQVIKEDA